MLFGWNSETVICNPCAAYGKPGVRLLRETITSIDAAAKRVTSGKAVHVADIRVMALGTEDMVVLKRASFLG